MAVIATWDGVEIDPDGLQNYGWYNTTIVVGSTSYRLLYGHMVAHLREADSIITAGQAAIDASVAAVGGLGVAMAYAAETGSTADAAPGDGKLTWNNATQASATVIYLDAQDAAGVDLLTLIDTLDDSTSTIKGHLRVTAVADNSKWIVYAVTAVTSATGYRKITVAAVDQSETSPFADGDALSITFSRTGDKGDTGTLELTVGTLTGSIDADGYNITGIGTLSATTATVTTATATDATVTDTLTLEGGMQAQSLYLGDVSGDVVIESSTPLHVYLTLVGDTTLLVAGGTEPGGAHAHMLHVTMGGAGGYALDVLPASLWTRSNEINHSDWTKTRATTSTGAGTAPDGQETAVKLVEDGTAAATHTLARTITKAASSLTYVFEGTFEYAGRHANIQLDDGGSNGVAATLNLSTGAFQTALAAFGSGWTAVSGSISTEGTGGWRVRLVFTTATATDLRFLLRMTDAAFSITYNGDSTSGVIISWLNLVEGSVALGRQLVGATRAGMVGWQGYPIEWTSIVAGADVYSMVVSAEADGRIIQQDHTPEEL